MEEGDVHFALHRHLPQLQPEGTCDGLEVGFAPPEETVVLAGRQPGRVHHQPAAPAPLVDHELGHVGEVVADDLGEDGSVLSRALPVVGVEVEVNERPGAEPGADLGLRRPHIVGVNLPVGEGTRTWANRAPSRLDIRA